MKIQGQHRFDAPREEVWSALLDPDVLAATVPGSQGLEKTGENAYAGSLRIKVGPVQGLFEGKVQLEDLDPPTGYHMKIEGRGPAGFMNGAGALRLSDEDGGTRLDYDVDAQVGGRIASVGQRLLDSSAKVITRQALEALGQQISARTASAVDGNGAGEAPAPAAPSQADFAAGVARGLARELVPQPYRRLFVMAAVGLTGVLLVLLVRSCAQ